MISGDRGGQGVGQSLPIHLLGNVASKNRRTYETQCGGAPSCWKIIHGWNSSEVQRKAPTCTGSFLVINVCNHGKNLCSPCIFWVYAALNIQHVERMRRIINANCGLSFYYVFPYYLINNKIFRKKLLNMRWVLYLSTVLSEKLLTILSRIHKCTVGINP